MTAPTATSVETRWGSEPGEVIANVAAAVSRFLDASYPDHLSGESILWRRVTKVGEEAGEVQNALRGWLGENPRKGATHTRSDVIDELLDCAGAALGAVEHLTGNAGTSVGLLAEQLVRKVAARLPEAKPLGETPCPTTEPATPSTRPSYVYVASSWRNTLQPAVIATLHAAQINCYDFRNPEGGTGFSWREVQPAYDGPRIGSDGLRAKGSDWEPVEDYLAMVNHPRAVEGFEADFAAMQRADTFVMVLPCGKSAHLELGWAIGAGKRTAVLLEDPVEPELMYRAADYLSPHLSDLLGWLGVED